MPAGPPSARAKVDSGYSEPVTIRAARIGATGFGLVAAAVFIAGVAADSHALRMVAKPWPVLLMAVAVLAAGGHRYRRLLGAGLLAGLAGDVLLEASDATFVAGVVAFLAGHLLYTAAFLGRSRQWRPLLALPFAAWGVAVAGLLRPGLEASDMLIPVAVYTAAIMVMVWRAAACWEAGGPSAVTLFALAGAFLFAVSDNLLAADRFFAPIAGARYAIILLYWSGQLGITLSALRFEETKR